MYLNQSSFYYSDADLGLENLEFIYLSVGNKLRHTLYDRT